MLIRCYGQKCGEGVVMPFFFHFVLVRDDLFAVIPYGCLSCRSECNVY